MSPRPASPRRIKAIGDALVGLGVLALIALVSVIVTRVIIGLDEFDALVVTVLVVFVLPTALRRLVLSRGHV